MAASTTLFMTEEESNRVRNTIQERIKTCEKITGQPWEPSDPQSLIQAATSTSLMQDLSSMAFGLGTQKKKDESMVAYAVGCPYLPSTAKLEDLKPIKLQDLLMETHHRGRVLSVRRVSPVAELKASSWAVVQGESLDDVGRLELFLHRSRHGQDMLVAGSEFFIKEPYYTLNTQGERVIKVDHPSDLVISVYADDPEGWRNRENTAARAETKSAAKCKEEGNAALQKQDAARAHQCYTAGLKTLSKDNPDDGTMIQDLHRNRSQANLLLQRYDESISDALASLVKGETEEQKSLDAKAYYRAGSAAYALGDYDKAKHYFEEQEKLQPGNQNANIYLRRIKLRVKERDSCIYDLNKIASGLSKNTGRPDVANYFGDTTIKKTKGAGRGLFAAKDIQANEIIMCERAFCVVWSYEPGAFSALTCDVRDDAAIRVFPAGLHRAVVQKLVNNPSQIEKVLDLYGDYEGLGKKAQSVDGSPVVDTFQIHDIIQRNAFGPGAQTEDEDVSNASTGLWVRAAYINHSCVSNAKKDYFGDMMLLRATRAIRKGEEITHSYDESSDFDARAAALQRTWGFKCRCALCAAEQADALEVRKRRADIAAKVDAFAQRENAKGANRILVNMAKKLRQSLSETYDEKRYKDLPRPALEAIDQWLKAAPSR
jgi:tetratricopeptide (TPR) repeat protein